MKTKIYGKKTYFILTLNTEDFAKAAMTSWSQCHSAWRYPDVIFQMPGCSSTWQVGFIDSQASPGTLPARNALRKSEIHMGGVSTPSWLHKSLILQTTKEVTPLFCGSLKVEGEQQKREVKLVWPSLNISYLPGPLFSVFFFIVPRRNTLKT